MSDSVGRCFVRCRRAVAAPRRPTGPAVLGGRDGHGRREPFDRQKLMVGLHRACEKRPVPAKALAAIGDEVEQMVQDNPEREIPARAIGEHVMDRLKELDKVAYVRFASVYRQFEDVEEFMAELRNLVDTRK